MSTRLQSCPLCEATSIAPLYLARDPHYGIPGSYSIWRCSDCSLAFLNPMYSEEELTGLYPTDYYAYQDEIRAGPWKQRAKRLLGYWQGTKDPQFEKPGVFLDIGCGGGTFVERMRDAGWDSHGVEVNPAAAAYAQSRGLQVFAGPLQAAQFDAQSFDYIRASHSLEHITCPHETLDEIGRILKPQGQLLIAVPNIEGFSAHLFRQYWYHLCPPIHAFNYSAKTLERMLSTHGFLLRQMVFNSHYAGILGSAQIWLNRRNGGSSAGGLYDIRALRVVCGWAMNVFDWMRMGDMIEALAVKSDR